MQSQSQQASTSWVAFSSYDLSDSQDGASQHLLELYHFLGPALSASLVETKQKSGWPRMSILQVLRAMLWRLGAWPWRWRDPRRGLLLGMHSLLLAPFFRPGVYVPLDCWSAREARLSAHTHGLRKYFRSLYAAAILLCEKLLLQRILRILVVSQAEKDAYVYRHPALAERVMVLPLRAPKGISPATPPLPSKNAPVLIWMDARIGYGRESIQTCLAALEAWPSLRITVLSRTEELGIELGPNKQNIAFADNLDALLGKQALVILPDTFGTGIKNRALEVAVRGIPMLATPYAIQGLNWQPPETFLWHYSNEYQFHTELESFMQCSRRERVARLRNRVLADTVNSEAKLLNIITEI